jgi:hypothetical protein
MRFLGSAAVALIILVLVDQGFNQGRYSQTVLKAGRSILPWLQI